MFTVQIDSLWKDKRGRNIEQRLGVGIKVQHFGFVSHFERVHFNHRQSTVFTMSKLVLKRLRIFRNEVLRALLFAEGNIAQRDIRLLAVGHKNKHTVPSEVCVEFLITTRLFNRLSI